MIVAGRLSVYRWSLYGKRLPFEYMSAELDRVVKSGVVGKGAEKRMRERAGIALSGLTITRSTLQLWGSYRS
jgi:hypothetical protein